LLQNNIFAGIGTLTNQASPIQKSNYRSVAPGFVNRAAYELRPTANPLVVDAGSTRGYAPTGVVLNAVAEYDHLALGRHRPSRGIDIWAYEASSAMAP
jgi:hypothetical protein